MELNSRDAKAYEFLKPLSVDYPDIRQWYFNKVLPGLNDESRYLKLIERDDRIVALGIAKKSDDEYKICTVRVSQDHIGKGFGIMVFDDLLKWLGIDQPNFTVNESKLPQFERMFDYYGFKKTSYCNGLYRPDSIEVGYNNAILRA